MSAADELETKLRQELAALRREYQERADPIVRKLVELENLKPRPPIIIPKEIADGSYMIGHRRIFDDEAKARLLLGDFAGN